jgi:hypothetical protein
MWVRNAVLRRAITGDKCALYRISPMLIANIWALTISCLKFSDIPLH